MTTRLGRNCPASVTASASLAARATCIPRRSSVAVSASAISACSSINSTRGGCCSLSRGASAFSRTAGSAP